MELYASFQEVAVNRIACDKLMRGVVDSLDGLLSTVIADVTTTSSDGIITRELFTIDARQQIPKNLDITHALHNKLKLDYGVDGDDLGSFSSGSMGGRNRQPNICVNDRFRSELADEQMYITYAAGEIESIRIGLSANVIHIGGRVESVAHVPTRGGIRARTLEQPEARILCTVGDSDKEMQFLLGSYSQFEIEGSCTKDVLRDLSNFINEKLKPTHVVVNNLRVAD